MSVSRRRALARMGTTVLVLGARDIAWGAAIIAVRVWPAAEYTRVTIESDAALSARPFMAENPSRLVIDVDGRLVERSSVATGRDRLIANAIQIVYPPDAGASLSPDGQTFVLVAGFDRRAPEPR